jgi:hypothetical protein
MMLVLRISDGWGFVGVEGIEPSASRSRTERSTGELHPEMVSPAGIEPASEV